MPAKQNCGDVLIIPQTGFLRVNDVLRFIPFRRTWLYDRIRDGSFPKPIKVGRSTVFKAEDIRGYIEQLGGGAA